MNRPNLKHYPHIFSPLQMFFNYINDMKKSIDDFLTQYLKPEGRDVLLMFNRYMIVVVILNVDIKLLVVIVMTVYMAVKVAKVKVWGGMKTSLRLMFKINKKKKSAIDRPR